MAHPSLLAQLRPYYLDILWIAARDWTFIDGMTQQELIEPHPDGKGKVIEIEHGCFSSEVTFHAHQRKEEGGWRYQVYRLKLDRQEVKHLKALFEPRREKGRRDYEEQKHANVIQFVRDFFPDAAI